MSIKLDRVLRIARHYYEHGTTRPKNRGVDRKKEAIKNHIQSFTSRESHYGRKAFGYPATDTCSTCQTYKSAVKNQNFMNDQKKLKTDDVFLKTERQYFFVFSVL
nr:uncharacterized protein LOC124814533 [Hydra vulgaris]